MRSSALIDSYGRTHDYLRISLTDKCNLRCFYCMPEEGIELKNRDSYMSADEVIQIATTFVDLGVKKIRLTGGEPLVRKDVGEIIARLSELPIELCLTTNAILLHKYIPLLKEHGVSKLNVSLDSLDAVKNLFIVKRDEFTRIMNNIELLMQEGIYPKLNVVLIKDLNDDEIISFVELTKKYPIDVRFIEFMPFNGNQWNMERCVSDAEVLEKVHLHYGPASVIPIKNEPNYTAREYKVEGYQGSFGLISTVTEPFCASCNRLRLTADGKLKNCLFGIDESDLLSACRNGLDLVPLIEANVKQKKAERGGLDFGSELDLIEAEKNRSMISIGG
ncbi:MAG: GTP 3',8-cyclase MoaA [Bacteroidia bacterium]